MSPSIDKIEQKASKTPMAPLVFVNNFLQEILRRLVVALAEHLQLHSMKNRWEIQSGKHRALSFADLSHEELDSS